MFKENDLQWVKNSELTKYKKRCFAPEMIQEDEKDITEKETKKMWSTLTASIKQFIALSENQEGKDE